MRLFGIALCLVTIAALGAQPPAANWESIKWTGGLGIAAPQSWKMDGDTLHLANPGRGGSLYSADAYDNFELAWEWRIAPGGNSGLKYVAVAGRLHPDFFKFVVWPAVTMISASAIMLAIAAFPVRRRWKRFGTVATLALTGWVLLNAGGLIIAFRRAAKYPTGLEYQMTDDASNADARSKPTHRSAALYDLIAPSGVALRPLDQFNESRIVVHGGHVEHWLNGVKALEYEFDSPALRYAVESSKFARETGFAHKSPGYLELQNHGDPVWFRNIRIRRL